MKRNSSQHSQSTINDINKFYNSSAVETSSNITRARSRGAEADRNRGRTRQSAYVPVEHVVWLFGVERARISRAIRVGELRTVRRRSGVLVPAAELDRLLGGGEPL